MLKKQQGKIAPVEVPEWYQQAILEERAPWYARLAPHAGMLLGWLGGGVLAVLVFMWLSGPSDPDLRELPAVAAGSGVPAPQQALGGLPVDPAALGERTVRLTVRSLPQGATVYLDEDSIGVTPLVSSGVRAGTHRLSVRSAEYAPFDTVLVLREDARLFLPLHFAGEPQRTAGEAVRMPTPAADRDPGPAWASAAPGPEAGAARVDRPGEDRPPEGSEVMVTSEPPGAAFWLDDEFLGTTPLAVQGVEEGLRQIRLEHEGYAPYAAEMDLDALTALHRTLTPEEPAAAEPAGERTGGAKTRAQRNEERYLYAAGQGDVLFEQGLYEKALARYHEMLRYRPQDAYALERIAACEREIENLQAREALREAVVDDGVYVVSDEPPVLIGGLEALHRRVQYPSRAIDAGVQGRVYVRFIVDEQGRVQQPAITRGLGFGCDAEVLRVVREARFEPGRVDGQAVKVQHTLFVEFRINR